MSQTNSERRTDIDEDRSGNRVAGRRKADKPAEGPVAGRQTPATLAARSRLRQHPSRRSVDARHDRTASDTRRSFMCFDTSGYVLSGVRSVRLRTNATRSLKTDRRERSFWKPQDTT